MAIHHWHGKYDHFRRVTCYMTSIRITLERGNKTRTDRHKTMSTLNQLAWVLRLTLMTSRVRKKQIDVILVVVVVVIFLRDHVVAKIAALFKSTHICVPIPLSPPRETYTVQIKRAYHTVKDYPSGVYFSSL